MEAVIIQLVVATALALITAVMSFYKPKKFIQNQLFVISIVCVGANFLVSSFIAFESLRWNDKMYKSIQEASLHSESMLELYQLELPLYDGSGDAVLIEDGNLYIVSGAMPSLDYLEEYCIAPEVSNDLWDTAIELALSLRLCSLAFGALKETYDDVKEAFNIKQEYSRQ